MRSQETIKQKVFDEKKSRAAKKRKKKMLEKWSFGNEIAVGLFFFSRILSERRIETKIAVGSEREKKQKLWPESVRVTISSMRDIWENVAVVFPQ